MAANRKPVGFNRFGGLRLDLPLDEVGAEQAQYLRDVDWDGNTGKIRPRDGFQKLKAAEATGPYKALFAHSPLRLLATKRVSSSSVKLVAIDKEGTEKVETTWPETAATACFAHFGTPSASYTYGRANLTTAKVVRFDGTTFTEPTCSVDGTTGKEMPRGKFMVGWPTGGDRLITANTGPTGGPGGVASSNSHVWISEAEGKAEAYESTAYLQLNPGDGEEITGLEVYGGQVFIFKETKFFVIYGISISEEGRPTFNYREVSLGEGSRMRRPVVTALAESSDTLTCSTEDGIYFCTSGGVWVTTGGAPSKISQALRPLEEVSPFDGPMAEFLNGSTETFRWPATGIQHVGQRLIIRRYEFMFVLDLPTGEWTCWKTAAVSMCIWTGLTGGGSESSSKAPTVTADQTGIGTKTWSNPTHAAGSGTEPYATASVGTSTATHYLFANTLGLAIPTGATIVGVEVAITRMATGFIFDQAVTLEIAGVPAGSNLKTAFVWPSSFAAAVYGGPENLWGLASITPAQANATNFGAGVSAFSEFGGVPTVKSFTVKVYFLTAEAASGVRPRLYCAQSKSIFVTAPGTLEELGTRDAEWQSGIYNLGTEDEKSIVEDKIWGSGQVGFSAYSDFSTTPDTGFPEALSMPALPMIGQVRSHKSQPSATLFCHKFSLEPGSQIQRIARYVREGRVPTTDTELP